MKATVVFILGISLTPALVCAESKESPDLPSAYTVTIQKVVSARTEVVGAASQLKAACEKKKEPCAAESIAYNKAKGAYDGWVSALKLAIKKGKVRKLKVNDPDYKAIAEPAAKESAGFVKFAEEKLVGTTKATGAEVLGIVEWGVKIWKEIRNANQEKRDSEAEAFAKEVSWPAWSEIK